MQHEVVPTLEVRAKLSYLDQVIRTGRRRSQLVFVTWLAVMLITSFYLHIREPFFWMAFMVFASVVATLGIAAIATVVSRQTYAIAIAEDGLNIELPEESESLFVSWMDVVRITDRFGSMGFILKKESIPFRYMTESVFESREAAQEFRAKANEYWRLARANQHELGACGSTEPAKIKCVRPKNV